MQRIQKLVAHVQAYFFWSADGSATKMFPELTHVSLLSGYVRASSWQRHPVIRYL